MSKYLHTILVVDDEEVIRDSFEDIFIKRGYKVLKACDGIEALDVIKGNVIDLAIVDIKMPRMDGITLLKSIKENYPDLPVIMMTGYGSEDIAVQVLSLGASNYLKKPFNLMRVIDTIEKVIFYKITRDRLHKKDLLVKKTLQNLKLFELTFPTDIEAIEGGVIFISEYLFCGTPFKTNIEIGVHEALLNAYYHGSLNIMEHIPLESSSESVDFYAIAAEKAKDESLRNKKISMRITSNESEYAFIIKDEGKGFNWQVACKNVETDLEKKPFGRGITLIKTFFDDVIWNEKGNEVTMILKKNSNKGQKVGEIDEN